MHILVIGNPTAGRGLTEARVHRFVGMLKARGHTVETLLTRKAGDAYDRARQVGPEVERLVVVGGDGTINETLNGLEDPSLVPLLHVPTGTANMMARDIGLPSRLEALAEIVDTGNVCMADIGLIGSKRFLLLATCGFDATVARVIGELRRERLGYRGYAGPILKVLWSYTPTDLKITIDGERKVTGRQVMVLNVRHYGGLFMFSHTAALDSGYFDVCVFQGGSRGAVVKYALAGLFRLVPKLTDVTRFTCTKIRIESPSPCPVEVDGDYFGTTPQEIELVRAAVPILVPRDASRF